MPKQFLDPQGLSQFTENLEQSIVADKYSSSTTYAVGDYCIYENLLYRCTTAIPSGESWNSSHWVQILIMGELIDLSKEATTTTPGLMSASDKVKLDGIESGAEVNVQSDWNAVSGDALILNKPVIPAAQVNSDWSASSGVAEILNKPTTISGYGITDAKIASGTITLGNNTITPLTQHQSVTDNNPTLTWGNKSKVATIGSTEINVTMPANPDTNTTYTFANGTNGFTVTPSGGTAQTVTVTPDLSSKMDKANPTGTGKLSLNRASGSSEGNYSVTLGENCVASGVRSYAEGYNTEASGSVSHAAGRSTIANHWAQYVFGAYNIEDPSSESSSSRGNYVEIVGNGTKSGDDITRSNARTLDWSGNEVLAGNLTINGNVSVGDAITLDASGTATRRITDISVTRSKIVKFNGIKFFNATIRADAAVSGGTGILDVSTGFESASQQSLLVTASTGGTIQAYIQSSTITTTNASALVSGTVYYIIGWYT